MYNPVKQVCVTGEEVFVVFTSQAMGLCFHSWPAYPMEVNSSGAPGVNGTREGVYRRAAFFSLLFILTGLSFHCILEVGVKTVTGVWLHVYTLKYKKIN